MYLKGPQKEEVLSSSHSRTKRSTSASLKFYDIKMDHLYGSEYLVQIIWLHREQCDPTIFPMLQSSTTENIV